MLLDEVTATTLLSGFPEPMLVMQPGGTLVFANDAAATLLAVDGSLEGRNITQFLPEQERSRLDPLAWMQRWAESPEAPEIEYVHLICRTQAGADRAVRVRVGRLRRPDETLYVVMLQDITADQSRLHEQRQAHRLAARVLAISADAIVSSRHMDTSRFPGRKGSPRTLASSSDNIQMALVWNGSRQALRPSP